MEIVLAVWGFVGSISNVIWSAVIASGLTLSGVMVSNRSNTARLKLQLEHDAKEKANERRIDARRSVYLETIAELTKVSALLAQAPQRDLQKENIANGLVDLHRCLAQVQMVAEPQAALLAMQLSAAYGQLVIEATVALMPVAQAKTDIAIAEESYKQAQAEVTRVLAEQTRQLESGNPDQRVLDVLSNNFHFYSKMAKDFSNKNQAAWKNFNERSIAWQKELFRQTQLIAPMTFKLTVEMRRELEFHGDMQEVGLEGVRQIELAGQLLNEALIKISEDRPSTP